MLCSKHSTSQQATNTGVSSAYRWRCYTYRFDKMSVLCMYDTNGWITEAILPVLTAVPCGHIPITRAWRVVW